MRACACRIGRGLRGQALDDRARHRRGEEEVAGGDGVDGGDQLLRPRALEQEPRRAGGERGEDVVVLLERREDHDADVVGEREQPLRGGDAVEARHPHVHQHHVRQQPVRRLERGGAVRRLADDLDALVAREDPAQADAHEVVVVDEQDADRLQFVALSH